VTNAPSDDGALEPVARARAQKPAGVARVRQPVKVASSRLWRARYVDLDGVVRQAGRFERKGDAISHTAAVVRRINSEGARATGVPTLADFLDEWPRRFPRHPRTQATNTERILRYMVPFLPDGGETQVDENRRADLRVVQDALLRQRLSKTTIDGALSALSALLRDAMDIELVEANVAARMRVRPADPRLDPIRGPVERRAVPPLGGQRSCRPMRRVPRRLLERRDHDLLDLLIAHRPRPSRPRLVQQALKPPFGEPVAPLGDRRTRHPLALGDLTVRQALRRAQHDPRPRPPGQRLNYTLHGSSAGTGFARPPSPGTRRRGVHFQPAPRGASSTGLDTGH
jgi:hypothetical protein